jgi:hypothetical protein
MILAANVPRQEGSSQSASAVNTAAQPTTLKR